MVGSSKQTTDRGHALLRMAFLCSLLWLAFHYLAPAYALTACAGFFALWAIARSFKLWLLIAFLLLIAWGLLNAQSITEFFVFYFMGGHDV